MAAYEALILLMRVIEQIEQHSPPPISLDKQQFQSLIEKVTFLQEFLEEFYSMQILGDETTTLDMRIADAAHSAKDIIESHIAGSTCRGICCFEFLKYFGGPTNEIVVGSTSHHDLYERLQKVIEEDMASICKEVMEINVIMRDDSPIYVSTIASIVGSDEVLMGIMDKLTRGQSDRLIIPIVGMDHRCGNILSTTIYQNQLVVQHFHIRAWVTVSQEYKVKEILLQLLQEDGGYMSDKNADEIGEKLYKRLCGRRYLIIIEDIWDIQVWDKLKCFFPGDRNGSRIMLTSSLAKLGFELADTPSLEINFLDVVTSSNYFLKMCSAKRIDLLNCR